MKSSIKFLFALIGPSKVVCGLGMGAMALLASCAKQPATEYLKGNTMGTFYTVRYWSVDKQDAPTIASKINDLLDRFESELSNWRKDSWINRLNVAPAGEYIHAPDCAYEVISLCLELAERSEGAFDPTLSPLIEVWGFGAQPAAGVPSADAVQAALKKTGYRKLKLDPENRTVLKTQPDLQLNCSAVAKGYAVDLVAQLLAESGIAHFLVNIGGEISAQGTDSDGSVWQVGISQPTPSGKRTQASRIVPLSNRSMATSGHSQRAYVIDGQRYSHILDPKTGYPVTPETGSATILAPNCALADGLATLALILDEDELSRMIASYEAVEIIRTPWKTEN